jgi:translation initiation factor 3 subunit C
MSFFAKLGSGSDTDSDSGSESEESILSGEEGLEQDRKLAAAQKPKNKASMFLKSDDESDEDSSEEEETDDEDESDEDGDKTVSGRVE